MDGETGESVSVRRRISRTEERGGTAKCLFRLEMKKFWVSHQKDVGRGF